MICDLCKQHKLRREFPHKTMTSKCEHAPLHCLRCVTKHVRASRKCSQCKETVDEEAQCYIDCCATLQRLFPEDLDYGAATATATTEAADTSQTISVVMLGGESTVIPHNPHMLIQTLKCTIQHKLGPHPDKQRLLYKEQEMKASIDSKMATLQDYGVQPFSSLHLIVMLYDIPQSFDEVIFDLFWGYPTKGCDYLDASVLLYNNSSLVEVVDYSHRDAQTGGVWHSGDVMDHTKCLGHHTINVKLKSIAQHVNKLFFTLSAWNSPNISKYKNPSLRFFDAKEPNKHLCNDQISHAVYSQAIIMCSLCKIDGSWKVFSLQKLSAGNALKYGQLKQTIESIIADRMC